MNKEIYVAFIDDAKETLEELKKLVLEEKRKGKENSEHQKIFNSIQRAFYQLKKILNTAFK